MPSDLGSSSAAQLLSQKTPGRQIPLNTDLILLILLQGIPTGGQESVFPAELGPKFPTLIYAQAPLHLDPITSHLSPSNW